MNVLGIQLTVLAGPEVPIPMNPILLDALLSVTVRQQAAETSLCQLSFRADPALLSPLLNPVVGDPQLDVWNRVVVMVTMQSLPTVLFDGLITHAQFQPGATSTSPVYTVTCEDLSVVMSRTQRSRAYPAMTYEEIALAILATYAEYGILPETVPPLIEDPPIPTESVHNQNGSDRDFLKSIAKRVGYLFYVEPGLVPLQNTAYWGPPDVVSIPQPTLGINLGAFSNVDSLEFSYSPLEATLVSGAALETAEGPAEQVPIQTVVSERIPLSAEPALLANATHEMTSLVDHGGADVAQSWQLSQARTDLSTDTVATATGSLDGVVYGHALKARSTVGVRGAGVSYDGLWYVREVTHQITRRDYKQQFSLSRDGLMSTVPVVIP